MTGNRSGYGTTHDRRFDLHGQQPRADKLSARQFKLCKVDPAFAEALRQRVSDPIRWAAFVEGRPAYHGNACPKCGSGRRRTRDRSCYACKLETSRLNFERIKLGVSPVAHQSREGYLDRLQRLHRERAGECLTFSAGRFTAQQYPTGRLAVRAPEVHIDSPDLGKLPGSTVVSLCHRYPELRDVLRWAGWSVPA